MTIIGLILAYFMTAILLFRIYAVADKYFKLYKNSDGVMYSSKDDFYRDQESKKLDPLFCLLAFVPVMNMLILFLNLIAILYYYMHWKTNTFVPSEREKIIVKIFGIDFTKIWNKWTLK